MRIRAVGNEGGKGRGLGGVMVRVISNERRVIGIIERIRKRERGILINGQCKLSQPSRRCFGSRRSFPSNEGFTRRGGSS